MWIRMKTVQTLVTLVTILSSVLSTVATGKTDYICIKQYYKVQVGLDDLQKDTATPGERRSLTMGCSEGQAIAVDNIHLKRTKCFTNNTCCPAEEDPSKQCDGAVSAVRRICNGKRSCEIEAGKRLRIILKSCRQAEYDYAEVKYTCTNANLTKNICDNFVTSSYFIELSSPGYPAEVNRGQHLCTCTLSSLQYFIAYFMVSFDAQFNNTCEGGHQTLSAAGQLGKGNLSKVFDCTNPELPQNQGFNQLSLTFHSNLTEDAGSFYLRIDGTVPYPGLRKSSAAPVRIECRDLLQTTTVYPYNTTVNPQTGAVTGASDTLIGAVIGGVLAVIVIVLLIILILRFKKRYGSWAAFKARRGQNTIPVTVSATDGDHDNMVGDHESKYLTMDSSNKNKQESTKYVNMDKRNSVNTTYENVPTNEPNQTINKKCASGKAVSKKKPTIKPKPNLGGKPPVKPKPKFFKKSDKKDKRVSEELYEIPEDPSTKLWIDPSQQEYYTVPDQERYEQLGNKTLYQDPDVYTSLDNGVDKGIYENSS